MLVGIVVELVRFAAMGLVLQLMKDRPVIRATDVYGPVRVEAVRYLMQVEAVQNQEILVT